MWHNSAQSALVVPSLNAGPSFNYFVAAINRLTLGTTFKILIDSGSTDSTIQMAINSDFTVHIIPPDEFNHGATRQLALSICPEAEIIIYMTQDAILSTPDSIKNLLAPFWEDERVGAVCGRQLPHADASPIAAHARLFNYPAVSSTKTKEDIPRFGIKAAFISNSFAAYRRTALLEVGGFPSDVIFGEDTYVATKMLQTGWKIAYAADATCYHSHNYSIKEELERYFDIGAFHSRENWFIESLGKPEGEGKRFVLSELRYLLEISPQHIPSACIRTLLKFIGYKLGQREKVLPLWLKRVLSMNKRYWQG